MMNARVVHARYESDPSFKSIVDSIEQAFTQSSALTVATLHDAINLAWERKMQKQTREMTERLASKNEPFSVPASSGEFVIGGMVYKKT